MKYFNTFLILSLLGYLSSCKKYSEYRTSFGSISIIPKNVKIKKAKIIPWSVGPLKKQKISKGISFQIRLPLLRHKHFTDLIKKDIDSWVLRVNRERISAVTMKHLEYISVPLAVRLKQRSYKTFKQLKTGTLNVFYAAATISNRLKRLKCPGLNHRKMIDKNKHIKIMPEYSIKKSIHVSAVYESPLELERHHFGYRPHTINGGNTLAGIYTFDLALYSSKEKKRMSNWFRLSNKVEITNEQEVFLKGCSKSNVVPLPPAPRKKTIKFIR